MKERANQCVKYVCIKGSFNRTRRCKRDGYLIRDGSWFCRQHDHEERNRRDQLRANKFRDRLSAARLDNDDQVVGSFMRHERSEVYLSILEQIRKDRM